MSDQLQNKSKAELLADLRFAHAQALVPDKSERLAHDLEVFREETRAQTEQLRTAHELIEQSRDRYADLYEYGPVAYATLDASGIIKEINLTGAALLENQRSHIVGHPLLGYIAAPDRRAFLDHLARCRRERGPIITELGIRTHTGQVIPAQLYSRNTPPDSEQPLHCRTAIIDLTEQRQAEQALQQTQEELRLTNEALAKRTAEAERRAAQLRALAAELSTTELRERRRLAEVLHDHLQQVLVAARMQVHLAERRTRMSEVKESLIQINEMLGKSVEISRTLTAELSPPVLYAADLEGALRWLVTSKHAQYGMEIGLEVEPDVEPVPEDVRVLLFQSVGELLFNIAKHAGVKAATVAVRRLDPGHVEVAVSDQGRGFDVAQFAASAAHRDHFGLFSVQQRFEFVGGRVDIQSTLGQGTRICLIAPTLENHADALDAAPVETRPEPSEPEFVVHASGTARRRGAKIRVLLADDHKILREGLAGLLRGQSDVEVIGEACDGQTAVDMALQLHPDLVLMDVSMPQLGGVEATRRICHELPNTRVIGLSMHEGPSIAAAMTEAGASAYLNKGCPSDDLISAIRHWAPAKCD